MSSSRRNRPIIVYQMGKVGSRSIYEALIDKNLGVPIYHCHVLDKFDSMKEDVRKQLSNPEVTLKVIEEGRELRKKIDEEPEQGWNLISLVRDPVAQDVSSFFYSLYELIPDIRARMASGTISISDLCQTFIEKWPRHNAPACWFDAFFKPVFGIDVFSKPFHPEKGYEILESGRFSVLLMRLEDLNTSVLPAMQEFLEISDFTIKRSNSASDAWYKMWYNEFINTAILPEIFLDEMYGSKMAKHFYSQKELDAFRAKWTVRWSVEELLAEYKKLVFELEKKLFEIEKKGVKKDEYIRHLEALMHNLESVISNKDARIQALLDSYSWKVTAPIRAGLRALTGRKE